MAYKGTKGNTLFTKTEKKLIGDRYFTIIREEDNYREVRSNNTKQYWIIVKKSFDSEKPITLYHKHTKATKCYHKHWETESVKKAVERIKRHDQYIIENGEIVRWKKKNEKTYRGV